jgi:hypothetical protein
MDVDIQRSFLFDCFAGESEQADRNERRRTSSGDTPRRLRDRRGGRPSPALQELLNAVGRAGGAVLQEPAGRRRPRRNDDRPEVARLRRVGGGDQPCRRFLEMIRDRGEPSGRVDPMENRVHHRHGRPAGALRRRLHASRRVVQAELRSLKLHGGIGQPAGCALQLVRRLKRPAPAEPLRRIDDAARSLDLPQRGLDGPPCPAQRTSPSPPRPMRAPGRGGRGSSSAHDSSDA